MYSVTWYADPVDNGEHATFAGALARVRDGIARGCDWRGYVVMNDDRCDEGRDGLSDDERDELDDAMRDRRRLSKAVEPARCGFHEMQSRNLVRAMTVTL